MNTDKPRITQPIRVFLPEESATIETFLTMARSKIFPTINSNIVTVRDPDHAELFLATNFDDLRPYYDTQPGPLFCIMAEGVDPTVGGSLINVVKIDSLHIFGENGASLLAKKIIECQPTSKLSLEPLAFVTPDDAPEFNKKYRVAVIDDVGTNLRIAKLLLMVHEVVVFRNLESALRYGMNKFDCVLTDMDMPPDRTYTALNLDSYAPGATVPYGFAVMIEAAKLGRPVAIVTDGNHHQGWVSAMFDDIKKITVNSTPVLFFNKIGKRWDLALKELEIATG